MASVLDVAQHVLELGGEMTTMKLQKLVYYCQAWHIAWHDDVLFKERIEAWADGPVTPELFKKHARAFRVRKISGAESSHLTDKEKKTISKIVEFYGDKSPQWLSDLTHQEDPWRLARKNLPARASCSEEITPQSMARYYTSL